MARKPIIGGNWKCNLTCDKVNSLLEDMVSKIDTSKCEVVVAPVSIHIPAVLGSAHRKDVQVSAQNCGFKGMGAYTGEVSADHLKDMGIPWVILGHSERREYFKEDDTMLAEKLKYVLSLGIKCIFCIGEKKDEREGGKTMEVCIKQMEQVKDLLDPATVVIAYEPVWAIGTGLTATPEMAQETHAQIRGWIKENCKEGVAEGIRIQYGGSAKAANAMDLAKQPDIDGFLVGGASLLPEFVTIVEHTAAAKGL